jgi:hypothetical protein
MEDRVVKRRIALPEALIREMLAHFKELDGSSFKAPHVFRLDRVKSIIEELDAILGGTRYMSARHGPTQEEADAASGDESEEAEDPDRRSTDR